MIHGARKIPTQANVGLEWVTHPPLTKTFVTGVRHRNHKVRYLPVRGRSATVVGCSASIAGRSGRVDGGLYPLSLLFLPLLQCFGLPLPPVF
jgi:hypothetical protein